MANRNRWNTKTRSAADIERQRQYNSAEYKDARAAAARLVQTGQARCWRPTCRRPITPGTAWHLGHDDHDRSIIRGPEHRHCNLSAAAKKANAIQAARHRQPRRNTTGWHSTGWTTPPSA